MTKPNQREKRRAIQLDKFLYGGFAVVALAGITTMLVSVFSPPKQPAEETVETPTPPQIEQSSPEPVVAVEPTQTATEYGVRYYDDNGNEIVPTPKILDAFKALDEERKRKEEELGEELSPIPLRWTSNAIKDYHK